MVQVKRKYRVLVVASHPVQYIAPLYRQMAKHPMLDLLVAYCTLQGAEPGVDPEFGIELSWDVPLLEGYSWVHVPNRSLNPGVGRFMGLVNPRLWSLVRGGKYDVMAIQGYSYLSFWIAIIAAKRFGIPILLSTDAVRLRNQKSGWWWKRWIKAPAVRLIFGVADIVLVPSTAAWKFIHSLGVSASRLGLVEYTVDNDYFEKAAAKVNRAAVRNRWNIPEEALVILFCAKLVPWKRPQDLLRAFRAVATSDFESQTGGPVYLVMAGGGPMRSALEAEARSLGVQEKVRFLGFVNQSGLPEVYAASDVLVLSSEHEAWGLVVNEAMVTGVPAIVSDRVGAKLDLIVSGRTGEVYPAGDVHALAETLQRLLSDREKLKQMGEAAKVRMKTWSYREHIEGFVEAIERAVELKQSEDRWIHSEG